MKLRGVYSKVFAFLRALVYCGYIFSFLVTFQGLDRALQSFDYIIHPSQLRCCPFALVALEFNIPIF